MATTKTFAQRFRIVWREVATRGLVTVATRVITILRDEGVVRLWRRTRRVVARSYHALPQGDFVEAYRAEAKAWYRRAGRKVVVIIPSYRDRHLLASCLAGLFASVEAAKVEVIVVDDNSQDAEHLSFLRALPHLYPSVRVILGEETLGFAGNVNRGLAVCGNDDVILMNSDVEPLPGWLETLQHAVYRHDAAIGSPRLLYPSGTIQFGGGMRSQHDATWFDHWCRFRAAAYLPALPDSYTLYATGAVMYLRHSALQQVGMFDPQFAMAFEDVDYCLRAWQMGLRTVYCGTACLLHRESATRGYEPDPRQNRAQAHFWNKQAAFFRRQVRDPQTGKPRLIFVTQDIGVGGGHRVVFSHANHLAKRGYTVELWNLAGTPDWYPLDPAIRIRAFDLYPELIHALAAEHAIKVATWWATAEPVWLSSIVNGIPVYFVQDIESMYYKDNSATAAMALASYRPEFDYATTCTWIKEELQNRFGLDATHIGLGYDSNRFRHLDLPRRKRTILVAARDEPLKNFAYSKEILARLQQHGAKVVAFGADGKQVLAGLDDVEFHAKPSDETLCRLYNEADFFLQTSIHEGFSLPPIEAMACGCAPIVTAAGGNEEYIADAKNAIVIPQANVDGAVRKILAVLDDAALRLALAANGRQTARRYHWDEPHRRMEEFVEAIAARPEYGVPVRALY